MQAGASIWQNVHIDNSRCKWLQTGASGYNQVQVVTSRCKWLQAGASGCNQVQVVASRFQTNDEMCKSLKAKRTTKYASGRNQVQVGAKRYAQTEKRPKSRHSKQVEHKLICRALLMAETLDGKWQKSNDMPATSSCLGCHIDDCAWRT